MTATTTQPRHPRRPVATPDTTTPDTPTADMNPAVVATDTATATATQQPARPGQVAGNMTGNMTAVTPEAVATPVAPGGHRGSPVPHRWPVAGRSATGRIIAAWLITAWIITMWLMTGGTPWCGVVDAAQTPVEVAHAGHTRWHAVGATAHSSAPHAVAPHTTAPPAAAGPRAGIGAGLLAQGDEFNGAPDLKQVITNLTNFLLDLARAATVAALILGGAMMAWSGGNTTVYARGKFAVGAGLGGFCVAFLAPAIVQAADSIVRGGGG